MTRLKRIQPGDRVALGLTAAESACLPYVQRLQSGGSGPALMVTLDELDEITQELVNLAQSTKDPKMLKKLHGVFKKIQKLVAHLEEEAPPAAKATRVLTGKQVHERSIPLYQLKITLKNTDPPIWRRIQVADCTLNQLHEHIQTAMGWTNSHLHQFRIGKDRYGDPRLLSDGFDEFECIDSRKTLVSKILPEKTNRFRFGYEYDFGDDWLHEVLFECCVTPDPKAKYPLCVEGARACPPEDVGGTWGFAEYLEIVTDPKHPERKERLEWSGPFHPETFDPKAATRAMRKGLPAWDDEETF